MNVFNSPPSAIKQKKTNKDSGTICITTAKIIHLGHKVLIIIGN